MLRPRTDVTLVDGHVEVEASYVEHGLVKAASEVTIQQVQPPSEYQRHLQLEALLKTFISERLQIPVTDFQNDNGLYDRVRRLEKNYSEDSESRWQTLWYNMGRVSDRVNPWLELIPGDYGLGLLKTGIAVVLKLAEHSVKEQEKVFKTFSTLDRVLVEIGPDCLFGTG
ncbi:hypothetical protein VTJ83DRAFT_6154 [Remersonia thermophila]|uniref:Uncharacterized protein n=1 Tax=Remersonia thermophila TaxID=72144 RepID=A0ABR4D957_9PEZI